LPPPNTVRPRPALPVIGRSTPALPEALLPAEDLSLVGFSNQHYCLLRTFPWSAFRTAAFQDEPFVAVDLWLRVLTPRQAPWFELAAAV
jgi:hypothetical protein